MAGTPILLVAFNRPEPTAKVFEAIRAAKPEVLYVATDGPRPGNHEDSAKVSRVRAITSQVDWPCLVKTLHRETNLGCKLAVSGAIDWFFQHESEGIILEDDCLPSGDFFPFCESLLTRYRDDSRIWSITGDNFQEGILRGEASYYFSRYPHVWGWATWKRCWAHYDADMSFWPAWRNTSGFAKLFRDTAERRHWKYLFDRVHAGEINTWDFQWVAAAWRKGTLTVTPQRNLVTNIGFGPDATHTRRPNTKMTVPISPLNCEALQHPDNVAADQEADRHAFWNVFYSNKVKSSWRSKVRGKLATKIKSLFRLT